MMHADPAQGFCIAGKTVRPAQGRVEDARQATRLEPRVMELLVYLARHQGEVVTRAAIIKAVWRGTAVTDDVISRSIYLIRKALGSENDPPGTTHIETIPKRGYRLIDEILPLEAATPVLSPAAADAAAAAPNLAPAAADAAPAGANAAAAAAVAAPGATAAAHGAPAAVDAALAAADVTPAAILTPAAAVSVPRLSGPAVRAPLSGPRVLSGTLRLLLAAGLIVGATIVARLWSTRVVSVTSPPVAAGAANTVPAASTPQAIAVLPFAAIGEAGEDAYISAGLSDEVIAALGSVEDLRVIGGFSARREQAEHRSYQEIGRELNVSAVLDGSVETHGDHMTLNTRLIDARSAQVIRDMTYVVDVGMSGALQKTVVNDVLKALGMAAPASSDGNGGHGGHEPNPDAYRLFLQGRYYAAQNNPGGYALARDYFSQAVKVDPEFARGWAALGIANMLMVDFGNRSRESATAEAEPAVKRALALEPKLAESQAAWGLIGLYNDRFQESAEALRRATALRPGYAQAHMWLGRLFVLHNEIRRAAAAFDRAYELEPQSPMVGLNLGMALDTEGRYDIAAKVLQETIAHNPKLANAYWAYAQLEWDRGDLGAAADAYRSAIDLGGDYTELYANYAVLLSDMGDMDGAARALTNVAMPRMNEPTVWAARAAIAANSGRYQEFLDYAASRRGGSDQDLWATLAEAKIELARGRSQRALNIYVHGRIEQRMSDGELAREIKFLGGPSALLDLACAHELSGNAAHADQLIQRAEAMIAADRERGINPSHYDYLLAAAASMRGDQARAIALIRVANERGWQRFAWFKADPRFAHLDDREGVLAALVNRKDKMAEVKRDAAL